MSKTDNPDTDTEDDDVFLENSDHVVIESEELPQLLYKISDRVPVHLTIFFAIQQTIISLSLNLVVSAVVADVSCAADFLDIRTDLLSSTLLITGVTTLLMVTVGVRLPVFQGASMDYVLPLLALKTLNPDLCKLPGERDPITNISMATNSTVHANVFSETDLRRGLAITKLSELQGCLLLAGAFHLLVGLTGIFGLLLKFIGPVTVVPAILLMSLYVSRAVVTFCRPHWGISAVTTITSVVLSLYFGNRKMPCPVWSRRKGCHIIWYPLHQVLSVLIGLLVGWCVSAILTHTGVLIDDQSAVGYMARTDTRADIIADAYWFKIPYPNRFGTPTINTSVLIGFIIGTFTSIIDSIGDYYACAKTCNVPPPPRYAVNRGVAVEGLGTVLSGVFGCGHATTTYGGNIGAIGLTKVASREVLVWTALIYIVFGVVGKVSAFFITIPQPALGGTMIVLFGMLNGVILSNLEVISLSSTRNLAIIGTSLLIGATIPYWLEKYPNDLQTGNPYKDYIVKTLLSNPVLCGGITATLLDNTVSGTEQERGISAWREPEKCTQTQYAEGVEVYALPVPTRWLSWKAMKFLPFCHYQDKEEHDQL